jgi:ribosomal protein S18 acetylase RimI-like enzyme
MPSSAIQVIPVNLHDERQAQAVVELLDIYASEPIGGGEGLSESVRQRLVPALRSQTTGCHFLAWDGTKAVGVAICFQGFSTFRAQPLINIHDLAVRPDYRGQGVGRKLIEAVAELARARDCCRLTLEVREDNHIARGLYERCGFRPESTTTPQSLFLMKWLVET